MRFPQARLLIFAKAPIPGRVKTRLTGKLGAVGAAKLYRRLLRRTLHLAGGASLCPVQLWCAPDTRHGFFQRCRRDYGIGLHRQQGADLGQRMHHALNTVLRRAPYAVLIGADCPSLGPAELQAAFMALAAGRDAVLGPAADGGYVLIGLRRPDGTLFRRIAWGSPAVLTATRRRLRRAGLDWVELPPGWDVDRPADLRRLQRRFPDLKASASKEHENA
ncbi:MAG: TIGR04282 family arsenosugar biosynthesis glycosyltransferase [Candidatus Competibacteraceae bacterium]